MGTINWTKDQQQIIDMRGCNILVSAAAGSGKTAVLVERIFKRITDKKNPVNVDQFVVVTFTKLAAAQMKDRLRERIEEALAEDPSNEHLLRQEGRLSLAHISTVHSFCSEIVKRYFHRIGLDPAFRMGTEAETRLLMQDVLDELLEEEYGKGEEDFLELAGMSEFNRHDDELGNLVGRIYNQMMGQPFPLRFLDEMEAFYDVKTVDEWENSRFMKNLLASTKNFLQGILKEYKALKDICHGPNQPLFYEPYLDEMLAFLSDLPENSGYEKYRAYFGRLPKLTIRAPRGLTEEEKANKEAVRLSCKDAEKRMVEWKEQYFDKEAEEHLNDLEDSSRKMKALFRLTRRLHELFVAEKRERGILDFNDLEQLTISILLQKDEESGAYVRTDAAKELANEFVEIMIDEYQDSNYVQDTILHAVSRDGLAGEMPNIFMVGDAKQSIYRFRGARPELFAEKLLSYNKKEGTLYRRIDLQKNFRSREIVLESTNEVFSRMMHTDIGGVEYDDEAKLHLGSDFENTDKKIAKNVDVYAILGKQNMEAEGTLAALKIQEMVSGETPLYVKDKEGYRKAEYGDVVIIVQTNSQGQAYFDALKDYEIPAVMEKKRGFFDTREIGLMVSMLQVIDNPHQDIPLAAVLLGPMFSLTEDELAVIRMENRTADLYDAILTYDKSDVLYEKLQHFLETLSYFRKKASYAAVGEIVQDIYDHTGIYEAVRLMPNGVQRNANMDSLMAIAWEFDGTTYHGLYSFVRYLEKISQQTEEMGEVNLSGEEENVVRIMTIHKSKGLEFPICIIGGMGHAIHVSDKSILTIHPDIAMVMPVVDNEKRTKKKTVYTHYLKYVNAQDELGEAMRKLYVAMTRAKEKLILLGCAKNTDSAAVTGENRQKIKTFFNMVLPAVHIRTDLFHLVEVETDDLILQVEHGMVQETVKEQALYNFDTTICYDKHLQEMYEWMDAADEPEPEPLPVKVSVSDLKIQSMEELDMEDFTILTHEEKEEEKPVPAFMQTETKEKSANRGAAYGTIWHQVMAVIDFANTEDEAQIRKEVKRLVETGRLCESDTEVLNYKRLSAFFDSTLGRKMRQAQKEGRLYREQPFVMGYPARDLFDERREDETILVQGIIDGYYETDDGIVLMDYKTDSLKQGDEKVLISRYRRQMELYRDALEKMTGKKVVKCLLYSFSLSETIEC